MSSQASFIQDGQQVLASDLNSLASSAAVSSGAAIASIIGLSDANANDSPLTVVPGSGMTIVVGGNGQKVLVQARLADYIPAQTYAIAAANSTDRVDLVAFRYADVIVSTGGTASFLDAQGNLGPQPTSYVYRGIQVAIVTGVPGAGIPAAPAGYDPLASVAVAAGATSIVAGAITSLLPSMGGGAGGSIPIYTAAGVTAGTMHVAQGSLQENIEANSFTNIGDQKLTVTLGGAAAFTGKDTYVVVASLDLTDWVPSTVIYGTVVAQRVNGSQFTLYITYGVAITPSTPYSYSGLTAGTAKIDWVAIGY